MEGTPPGHDDAAATAFPDAALLAEMAAIPDPAVLFLPGSRIAAVNPAAARLFGRPAVGLRGPDLVEQRSVRHTDLPHARALRGEVIGHGERIAMTFLDGSTYQALVTSTPVVRDGTVVAALSVWHDFSALVRQLRDRPADSP